MFKIYPIIIIDKVLKTFAGSPGVRRESRWKRPLLIEEKAEFATQMQKG